MIDWQETKAAIWRANKQALKPVFEVDPISLEKLIGIDRQKNILLENTKRFVDGFLANHALLWGSRGMGKSALVKALLNHFSHKGLRLIEFAKEDLLDLPELTDYLRELPYYFIIFCDDLSFERGDDSYKGLKPLLEGSIELPPKNILVYATSNRRHLVTEHHSDNEGVMVADKEIHYSDAIEEKISLSDRFGLWLSFYQGSLNEYLRIVDSYFKDFQGDRQALHEKAKQFATTRASRSGRTAKQFYITECGLHNTDFKKMDGK